MSDLREALTASPCIPQEYISGKDVTCKKVEGKLDPVFDLQESSPHTVMRTDDDAVCVQVEIPKDIDPKNFKVAVEGNQLCITGHIEKHTKCEEKSNLYESMIVQNYNRKFSLPDNCLTNKCSKDIQGQTIFITIPREKERQQERSQEHHQSRRK